MWDSFKCDGLQSKPGNPTACEGRRDLSWGCLFGMSLQMCCCWGTQSSSAPHHKASVGSREVIWGRYHTAVSQDLDGSALGLSLGLAQTGIGRGVNWLRFNAHKAEAMVMFGKACRDCGRWSLPQEAGAWRGHLSLLIAPSGGPRGLEMPLPSRVWHDACCHSCWPMHGPQQSGLERI